MKKRTRRISAFKECKVLCRQYFIMLKSDRKNLMVMLLFPAIAAFITIWIAGENMFVHYDGTKSASFVIVSAAIWGGLFNSIQTVVKERDNIKRDYVTGLRLRCYIFSRASLQLILCVIQSAILSLAYVGVQIVYGNSIPDKGIIFGNAFIEYYISILLLMYAADAMGLMISCIVRKTETANVLAPYILIVQLIFSGILFSMSGLADKVSYVMLSRWGMEALGSISNLNALPMKIAGISHSMEEMFESSVGHLYTIWGVFLFFITLFIFVGDLLLHRVSKDAR